jgi:hypothetical protein
LWRNSIFHYQGIQANGLPHRGNRRCPPLSIPDDFVAIAEATDNNPSFEEPPPQLTGKVNAKAAPRARRPAAEAREILVRNNDVRLLTSFAEIASNMWEQRENAIRSRNVVEKFLNEKKESTRSIKASSKI